MKAPSIARILGVAFIVAGIAGMVPQITPPAPLTAQWVTLQSNYGFLAGLFPVNLVHDALHVFLGAWGVLAGGKFKAAVTYCKSVAWIYAVLVVLGVIPITNTLFGVAPIYGFDVLLHFVVALFAFYGGYGAGRFEATPLEEPVASTPPAGA